MLGHLTYYLIINVKELECISFGITVWCQTPIESFHRNIVRLYLKSVDQVLIQQHRYCPANDLSH